MASVSQPGGPRGWSLAKGAEQTYDPRNASRDGSRPVAGPPLPGGPFPVAGLIGWFKPLYDYSWVVGLVAAFLLYYLLTTVFPAQREERRPAAAPAT